MLDFNEAFEKFVKGQTVVGLTEVYPNQIVDEPCAYGYGVVLENGYKIIGYGAGGGGYDYNDQYIINDKNELVSKIEAMSV